MGTHDVTTKYSPIGQSLAFSQVLPAGTSAGEYVLDALIGEGGCGRVYRATHAATGRAAAVKVIQPTGDDGERGRVRFEREARAASAVRHPNLVEVLEVGTLADGRPYFAMELLDGQNLSELIRSAGRLSPAEALEILEPVCAALQAVHDAGIIHRDIKGGNVFLAQQGGRRVVKLLDFGVAKLLAPQAGPALTQEGQWVGTPSVMAPEQFQGGAVDARTDIYSLGVMLYQLLTGNMPFSGTAEEIERSHLKVPVLPPSRLAPVGPLLDGIVLKCLEKDPARRYPSASSFLAALRQVVENGAGVAPSVATGRAVGIYVEARLSDAAAQEPTDSHLETLDEVMDETERELASAGLQRVPQSGTGVLAVQLLSRDDAAAKEEKARALRFAQGLYERLTARLAKDRDVAIFISVHLAGVDVSESDSAPTLVGGPLLAVGSWLPRAGAGVQLTAAAREE